MITDRQLDFILNLYEEIGQEPEIGIENLSKTEASEVIKELLEIKGEIEQ